jgi:outer membrane lipoprotein SlyB
MDTNLQPNSPSALMWIAGVAVIVFSATGIAAIMGWIPASMEYVNGQTDVATRSKTAGNAPAAPSRTVTVSHATSTAHAAPARIVERAIVRSECADCGVVESTREIARKGLGAGVGAIGGAVAGGLTGNQIGFGGGNVAATAIGTAGDAVAGNEAKKRVESTKAYEVTVRLDDGSSRVVSEGGTPAWHAGDRVKIVSGEIQSQP